MAFHHIVCFIPPCASIEVILFIPGILHNKIGRIDRLLYPRIGNRFELWFTVKKNKDRWGLNENNLGRCIVEAGLLLHQRLGIFQAGIQFVHNHIKAPLGDLSLERILEFLDFIGIVLVLVGETYIQYFHAAHAHLPACAVHRNSGHKPDGAESRLLTVFCIGNRSPAI